MRYLYVHAALVLAAFCYSPLAVAADFYVSSDGDDHASGLGSGQAWRTIERVNQFGRENGFRPGDRVLFEAGATFDDATLEIVNSGVEGAPITFGSFGNGRARLTRSGVDHAEIVSLVDQQHVIVENLEISSPDYGPDKVTRGIRLEFTQPGDYVGITIRNNHIRDVHGGMWHNRHLRGGIWMRTQQDVDARVLDMLVENNRIERVHSRGMRIGGQNQALQHERLVIRNNHVEDTSQGGIVAAGWKGVLMDGNTVYGAGRYYPDGDQAGVLAALWAAHSEDVVIQRNEVAYTKLGDVTRPDGNLNEQSHDSQAFDIDVGAPGRHLIQHNYSHHNEGGFMLFMGDPGPDFEWAAVRYNLSVNDGKGFDNRLFELHTHKDGKNFPVLVSHNTFVNDERIWVNNRAPSEDIHDGWVFENNIFSAPDIDFDDLTSIVYHNNLYDSLDAPDADPFAIFADPRFLDGLLNGDGWEGIEGFSLAAGSPAYQAAVQGVLAARIEADSLGGHLLSDILGNPLPYWLRTIGAFELSPVVPEPASSLAVLSAGLAILGKRAIRQ